MRYEHQHSVQLLKQVASELESIRDHENYTTNNGTTTTTTAKRCCYNDVGVKFPRACLQYLQSLPGNTHCVDCGTPNPDWASITYGTLLCLQCSGVHRSYGVQVSYVRSISYDTWNHPQILSLLEGGNTQLRTFFQRHELLNNNNSNTTTENHLGIQLYNKRYHTKAALFYKVNLKQHVQNVIQNGHYRGREYNRQQQQGQKHDTHSSNKTQYGTSRSMSPTSVLAVRNNNNNDVVNRLVPPLPALDESVMQHLSSSKISNSNNNVQPATNNNIGTAIVEVL